MKKRLCFLFGLLLLTGCATSENEGNMSAEDLYNQAWEDLEATKYQKAAKGFEKIELEHPYSKWAVKSKLMGAYAYFKDEKYDDAVLALDRFIQYHPGNKDVAYAYYLRGMCYYNQISAADKDQGDTERAEETFQRLIMLFPESKYAEDARKKINLTEDYKAGQEMVIGRFYLKDKNYLSALNRFNVVLENYQTTVQIEEALYREVEIYAILGLNKYADGYYKILLKNYPQGKWTAKATDIMQKINNTGATNGKNIVSETTETRSWLDKLKWWKNDKESVAKTKTENKVETTDKTQEISWLDKLKWWKNNSPENSKEGK